MVENIFRTRLETDSVHGGREILYKAGDRFCQRWETDLDLSWFLTHILFSNRYIDGDRLLGITL